MKGKSIIGLIAMVLLSSSVMVVMGGGDMNAISTAENARYEAQLQFNSFTRTYNKRYGTVEETLKRFEIFQKTFEWINKKNNEQSSFTVAINHFADMTPEEIRSHFSGPVKFGNASSHHVSLAIDHNDLPTDVDWRKKGAVTPVSDQGNCGSTWAFGPIAAIEGANFIKTGKLVKLSEGELVDCADEFGSQGCNGGDPTTVYQFGVKYGICTAADYPYAPQHQTCKRNTCTPAVWLTGYVALKPNEDDLLTATATTPVHVNVDASCPSFMFYQSGVMDDTSCTRNVNHCLTAVGFGTDTALGKDYWIFKNMWGANFGDKGYLRLVRNKDQCGIASSTDFPNTYPLV